MSTTGAGPEPGGYRLPPEALVPAAAVGSLRSLATDRRDGSVRGRVLLVSGAAGSGKSAVVELVTLATRDTGGRLLVTQSSRAGEWPGQLLYDVLTAPVIAAGRPEQSIGLPAAALQALAEAPHHRSARGHEAVWSALAARVGPGRDLAVVVEDVHGCDPASARWLPDLVRELAAAGCLVVLSSRSPARTATASRLVAAMPPDVLMRLDLEPLDRTGTAQLLRSADLVVDERDAEYLLQLTGGSPVALAYVAGALVERDAVHHLDRHAVLHREIADQFVLPARHPLLAPVNELGPDAWRVGCTAALAPFVLPSDGAVLARAAQADQEVVAATHETFVELGVLHHAGVLCGADVLRFVSRLVRTSLAACLPPVRRHRARSQLAQHLLAQASGAAGAPDRELLDWLVACRPLVDAAGLAALMDRADRALDPATGWGIEEPVPRLLLGDVVRGHAVAGECAEAERALGVAALDLDPARLRVQRAMLRVLALQPDAARKELTGASADAPTGPGEAVVRAAHVWLAHLRGERPTHEWAAPPGSPSRPVEFVQDVVAVMEGAWRPPARPARRTPGDSVGDLVPWLPPRRQVAATQLFLMGRWEQVLSLARREVPPVRPVADPFVVRDIAATAAEVLTRRGEPGRARFFLQVAEDTGGWTPRLAWARAGLHLLLGEAANATAAVEQGVGAAESWGVDLDLLMARAVEVFLEAGDHSSARSSLAELGRVERRLGSPRSTVLLARSRAVLDRDAAAAQEALTLAARRRQPAELADAALVAGDLGVRPAQCLHTAWRLFGRLGADPWRCRTEAAMHAVGVPVSGGRGQGSADDRLLVRLVADGLTNRQVARVLRCSEKTVEVRLRRQLDVAGYRSRAELAAAVTSGTRTGPVARRSAASEAEIALR